MKKMMTSNSNLYLVFIKPICKNADGNYEYDMFFSETPDIVYGPEWDDNNPSSAIGGDLTPDSTTFSVIKRIALPLPLRVIQETSCYSMEYAMNRIIALGWINIEGMEEYPKNGRMVMMFGDTIEKINELLSPYDISVC